MPELSNLIAFSLIALGMVLTPGPNMIYVISRSISQGRKAGLISLGDGTSVLSQSLILGSAQILVSLSVNAMVAMAAGSIAMLLTRKPGWAIVQRWLMGTVLFGFAVRMAVEGRR